MRRNAFGALWQGEPQTSGHYGAKYSSVGLIGGSGVGFMPPSCGNLAEGSAHFSWRCATSPLLGVSFRRLRRVEATVATRPISLGDKEKPRPADSNYKGAFRQLRVNA